MEPLKRFTQCGSLTMLFAVFIVLFGVSSTALTTFGKSPQSPPPPPPPPTARARECQTHNDCGSIQHTSCVRDGAEKTMRCLCGNNKVPQNGACKDTVKQLRHQCTDDASCGDELICGLENPNKTTGFTRNPSAIVPQKICLCDESSGFTEDVEDNTCNDSGRLIAGIFIPLTSLILGVVASRRQSIY
ncbi:uncharacterized protein LOC129578072 [Sitodiplosis mosellana]|uniref:uncharacterized protein LOC129578072 n=1 Tax=Sitodiplosis mosellana TaxID=263140 RepID=UPI0024446BFD|nr:uncharacterized protein LOC129578072 [Sitodiplosis mosellana]XP_055322124.1 uncharacterized protein LOC129578072 [Sitodiplosis mosellana]XP_055322125.1 uncharacterized protein LOC129578072 [Sitodiplosis mosellana]XP_055322126.1 uncharacterized protein LOC129578072 [Sitodiplosis mosellana]XP_055322127.1 uncharacterized protein LOC129578072 [Sitodiplosis mosellana]XP_055322128.1 uncharacterized protein LOC129578072 [Sitodiplosis mosellana]XP_055322129.1 uncharacterized protein LOC129578072 [